MLKTSHNLKKKIFATALIFFFILTACEVKKFDDMEGVATWTPSPSLTPTCVPIALSTPDDWGGRPRLISVLYDPRSMDDQSLEFKNNGKTQDMLLFMSKVIPNIMHPSDQVAIFHLGYSTYEAARVSRPTSHTFKPLLYDTPSPYEKIPTLTPLPPDYGFDNVAAQNEHRKQSTAIANTQQADEQLYNCKVAQWDSVVKSTATAWDATATAEIGGITINLYDDLKKFEQNLNGETPYSTDELFYGGIYHGLSFVTRVFQAECSKYGDCILVIIDDMRVYHEHNQDMLPIDLYEANIFVIMPNCVDMQDTKCLERQKYWSNEIEILNGGEITYSNGSRAETNLLEYFNSKNK